MGLTNKCHYLEEMNKIEFSTVINQLFDAVAHKSVKKNMIVFHKQELCVNMEARERIIGADV